MKVGPNLLGSQVLESPGSFKISNIFRGEPCDLKLVGEDGDTCVLRNMQLFSNQTIDIKGGWLLGCEMVTRAAGL
jgi:hypothetical protein